MTTRLQSETGSGSVLTVTLLAPVFVLLLGFITFAGRVSAARHDVDSAARDAARAASLATDLTGADAAAQRTAEATLASRKVTCQTLSVETRYQPLAVGQAVQVTLTCVVGLGDLAGLGLPGHRTVRTVAYESIDRYRGGP